MKYPLLYCLFLISVACTNQDKRNAAESPTKGIDKVNAEDTVTSYYRSYAEKTSAPSISKGSVSKGSLVNGKLIPFSGNNFHYFDTISYINGRAFLNNKVLNTVLESYSELEREIPNREFCIMECSNEHGGKMNPHRTHQNGLSVDFMVPLIRNDKPYYKLDSLGRAHYLLEFIDDGTYDKDSTVRIDFELIAQHILVLNKSAKANGLKISKVIFKMELKDELYAGKYGQELKKSGIYITRNLTPIINTLHDDHYHIDFEVTH